MSLISVVERFHIGEYVGLGTGLGEIVIEMDQFALEAD